MCTYRSAVGDEELRDRDYPVATCLDPADIGDDDGAYLSARNYAEDDDDDE